MPTQAQVNIILSNGQQAGQTLKELQKDANRLNKEIKDLKPGSAAFINKSKDLQQVNGRLRQVKSEINGVTQANGGLLKSFGNILPFSGQFGRFTGVLNQVSGGVGGVSRQFGILRGAIIATGIGALVIVVLAIVNAFKASEAGQDKWNKIMKVSGVIINNIRDLLADLGEKLIDTFSNPKKAVEDLWAAIKENILNRFTGLIDTFKFTGKAIYDALHFNWDDFKKDAASAGESIVQSFTGVDDLPGKIKNGFNQAREAIKGVIDETKEEMKVAAQLADLQAKTDRMERALMVERAGVQAEIQNLRVKAYDKENYSAQERLAALQQAGLLENELLQKELAVAQNRYEIIHQQNQLSKSSKEDLDNEAQALAHLDELRAQAATMQLSIVSQSQRINKEINKEKAQAAKDEADAAKNIHDLKLQLMDDELEQSIEKIRQGTDEKIAALSGSEEQITQQRVLLEELREKQIQDVKDKFQKEADDKKKKADEEQRKIDQEARDKNFDDAKNTAGELQGLFKEGTVAYKGAASAQVTLDGIKEVQGIWASSGELGPLGTIWAIVRTGIAIARTAVALNKINSVSYGFGGILRGRKHSQGGIPGVITDTGQPIEMEGDEIILTGNVSRSPAGRAAASSLNARYGGIRFEAGGPVNPLSSVSSSSGNIQTPTAGVADFTRIERLLSDNLQAINSWQRDLQVHNNVQDTRKGINVINDLEDASNF